MKDIDFDELDRAVGSALGTDNTVNPDTSTVAVANTTYSAPQDNTPLPVSIDPPATMSPPPLAPAKPASPARRRGQFLDMVHPSADMRSTTPFPSVVRKKITPINTDTTPEQLADKPDEESASSYSSYPSVAQSVATDSISPFEEAKATEVVEDAPSDHTAWPDPLDLASSPMKTEDKAAIDETDDQPFSVVESISPDDVTKTEPSQTPFVTDAKVDKRPLGAFASVDEETEASTVSEHAADAAQLTPDAESSAPEFSSDINSVEAAGVSQVESENIAVTETPEPVSFEKPAETPTPVVTPNTTSSTNDGVAQSIPQQYKTAEVKKDDDAHSLFDTKEYHQPLLPDGKKKSKKGVLIVVLLVVLLIIGAALGYVAYTMGI